MASHWIKSGRRNTWRCVTTVCWPTIPVYMWVHYALWMFSSIRALSSSGTNCVWCGFVVPSLVEELLPLSSFPPSEKGIIWNKTHWCKSSSFETPRTGVPMHLKRWFKPLFCADVFTDLIQNQKLLLRKRVLDILKSEESSGICGVQWLWLGLKMA